MKQNKGVIGIGLILAIVLGIVVVGGGAYYLTSGPSGNDGNREESIINYNAENSIYNQDLLVEDTKKEEKTNTTPSVVSDCDSSSKPSIKVLSPNGGEEYGIKSHSIPVLWESCNYKDTENDSFIVKLINLDTGKEEIVDSEENRYPSYNFNPYYKSYGQIDNRYLQKKGNYKILVCGAKTVRTDGFSSLEDIPDCSISDYSDNYFVYKTDSRYAVINSIYKKENKYYIDVSYWDILSSEEDLKEEGACIKEDDCPAGYYEKNLNENGTLEIDPNVDITVMTYLGSEVDSQYKKLDKFVDYVAPGKSCSSCSFYLKIEDNKVISMGQFIGN